MFFDYCSIFFWSTFVRTGLLLGNYVQFCPQRISSPVFDRRNILDSFILINSIDNMQRLLNLWSAKSTVVVCGPHAYCRCPCYVDQWSVNIVSQLCSPSDKTDCYLGSDNKNMYSTVIYKSLFRGSTMY